MNRTPSTGSRPDTGRDTDPPARPQELLVDLVGFSFQYRAQSTPTLHGIDLQVRRGEKVAVVGASGSGKSTLLAAINGLIPHRHAGTVTGTIRVAGTDPAQVPLVATAARAGTVLQDTSSQFVGLTVAEDIAFSLENQQVPHREMPERVTRAAALAGIDDRLDTAPQALSGGQKQRVAIAGVLVDDVDLLLFDEPLANLDPAAGRAAVELIDDLHRLQHRTVIIVEHRLEDVLHRPVDRIVLMAAGRIVVDAGPDEVLASGLLEQHGIRPPLHVAALRLAGAPVTAAQRPARLADFTPAPEQIAAVRSWAADGTGASQHAAGRPTAAGDAPGAPDAGPDTREVSEHRAPAAEPPAPTPEPPALDLDRVRCELPLGPERTTTALEDVTATVRRGELIGVIGSNGAGKSTLARVVCGFERATGGSVRLGGEDAAGWSLAARGERVGFVLQEPGQMISQPQVADEIALGMRARGLSEEEIAARSARVLEVCGLRSMRSWPVAALSHGQKKRVTIAAVLALAPEVLILDEPTAGQDFGHYTEFMDFLARVNAEGTTIVLITHDMHLALEYTERVLVMSGGHLLADAHPAAVLTDPELTARADLVTTSLHTLAQRCGIDAPEALVRRFVAADRAERTARA